jgi:hypothetical protein
MSQERAFIETLCGQRFNFLLVFFGLVVAGGVNAKSDCFRFALLSSGAVICFLLSLALYRAQYKLNLILLELKKDPTHPAIIIDKLAKGPSMRRLIGYCIPTLCWVSLCAAAIAIKIGWLK